MFDNVVGWLRQSIVLRKLFGPLYHALHRNKSISAVEDLKVNFRDKGLKVLELFDHILTENGFKYSLAFGTLLGAVREKGFIKHDADIDVFMWIDDYSPFLIECLSKYGFIVSHTFTVENDKCGKEDTIMLDGVQIDIFYIYPPLEGCKYPYCCDFIVHPDCISREHSLRKYGGLLPRRIEIPISKDLERVPFESLTLPILTNAHEFLLFRYGKDYMTPNPSWTSGSNPHIVPWMGKVAMFK